MSGLDFDTDGADWPLREASRFVRAGGYRWHVQEFGEGPPALLLHGAAGATHSWRALAPLLARHFHLVSPDLPGHAFTTPETRLDASLKGHAQALEALLDALDYRPKLVIGHSAGAVILGRLIAEGRLAPDLFVCINGAFFPFEGAAGHILPVMARLMHLNPLAGRLFAWTADRRQVGLLIKGMGSQIDDFGLDLYTRLMTTPSHCAGALDMVANWDLSPDSRRPPPHQGSDLADRRRERQGDPAEHGRAHPEVPAPRAGRAPCGRPPRPRGKPPRRRRRDRGRLGRPLLANNVAPGFSGSRPTKMAC